MVFVSALLTGCAEELPDEVANYRERCVRMTAERLPERDDDPHRGEKHVYACDVSMQSLVDNVRPFSDGVRIIKESQRRDTSYPWLVAVAEKRNGSWQWSEYSRNFESEPYLSVLASEQVCIDCHRGIQAQDWIFTRYTAGEESASTPR